jgi:hypothetical protein
MSLIRNGTRELPLTVIHITFDFQEGDEAAATLYVCPLLDE